MHELSLALARNPAVVLFARRLVERVRPEDRLARIAGVFTFVSHLVHTAHAAGRPGWDGVDWLLALAGEDEGPAVVLAALLLALGERACVEWRPGLAFVRVELELADVRRLPPHAGLLRRGGRLCVPLDPRDPRSPLGFLPRLARLAARGPRPA